MCFRLEKGKLFTETSPSCSATFWSDTIWTFHPKNCSSFCQSAVVSATLKGWLPVIERGLPFSSHTNGDVNENKFEISKQPFVVSKLLGSFWMWVQPTSMAAHSHSVQNFIEPVPVCNLKLWAFFFSFIAKGRRFNRLRVHCVALAW